MNRDDLLTWKGIRALASAEILAFDPKVKAKVVTMDLARPQITWGYQRHFAREAIPTIPDAGSIVFARAGWRTPWRGQWMKTVQQPIVLCSTFYDQPVKQATLDDMFRVDSPVTHWFGVQAAGTHPSFTPMPIGIKSKMIPVLQAGERRAERDILCYCNFVTSRVGRGVDLDRMAIWKHFTSLLWVTPQTWNGNDPARYVNDLGRSKFVLSPPGLGYDCYRTYEAIVMGAIPIVKRRRPQTDVCEELPVLLVDEWADVTETRLTREWEQRQQKMTRTLTLSYWREQIRAKAQEYAHVQNFASA